MPNSTFSFSIPPLPDFTLHSLPPLVPGIPDKYLVLILPLVAYWTVSMFFHWIDVNDWFPQYRLHTPAEVLQRNHVSRWEVFRDVILQQVIQTAFGLLLGYFEPEPLYGKEVYDVALWAHRIRMAQRALPTVLSALGVNASLLAANLKPSLPGLSGALSGGHYPWLSETISVRGEVMAVPAFAYWELLMAKGIYFVLVPALQFLVAIFIVDTWQYFWHRAMHMNKWLYTTFHSRHHRLYVPYAYGALYNHPLEGFLLDTLGAGIAYLITSMSPRQAMWFFTCSTIKTIDDHCGYALPWDPLQHLTSNNASYHDIHHQSWGIKTNFSQPFFTFWDRFMGTMWTGGDASARYERTRLAAEKKAVAAGASAPAKESARAGEPMPSAEVTEEREVPISIPLSQRKRRNLSTQQSGGLKGLRGRVQGSLHGRGSGVLGVESGL